MLPAPRLLPPVRRRRPWMRPQRFKTVQPSSTPALALRAVWLRWLLALIAALAGAMVEWPR